MDVLGKLGIGDGILHALGAGFLTDTLKSAISPYLNQYLADKSARRDYNNMKTAFLWQFASDKYAQDRTEAMQREAWKRDDEAYQRQTVDMQKAGINPILINGAQGSSSASFSGGASASPSATPYAQMQSSDPLATLSSLVQYADSAELAREEFQNQKENESEANKRANAQETDRAEQAKIQTQILEAQRKKAEIEAEDANYELNYKRSHGYSSTSSDKYKTVKEVGSDAKNLGNKAVDKIVESKNNKETLPEIEKDLGKQNLNDFASWLSTVNKTDYRSYLDGDEKVREKIAQHYRNRYMREIKNFKR